MINDILQDVIGGCQSARNDMYERCDSTIRRCITITIKRSGIQLVIEDIDDLVNHVWLCLLCENCRKLRRFDPKRGEFSTWLYMTTKHAIIDYARRYWKSRRFDPAMAISNADFFFNSIPDEPRTSPDIVIGLRQQLMGVQETLSQFTPVSQQCLQYHLDGLKDKEISSIIGITEAAVKVRRNKIRTRLRKAA